MPRQHALGGFRLGCAALLCAYLAMSSIPAQADPPTSVDLSTYVRVGRYDLPEPTRTAAPANSLLAQEASNVTYNWDTDTLFITGDGGTSVVQVSKTGQLIDSMSLAPGGSPQGTEFYDTEGLTYVGNGQFVLLEERYRQANLFTYVAGGTLQRSATKTVKLGTTIGNTGLEGLSWDPSTSGFIFVKEKDPESVFQTTINWTSLTASNGSPTATSSTDLFNPSLAGLLDFSDVFALSGVPSLSGQPDSSHLLIISQESGQVVNVDRSGVVYSRLTIQADPNSPLTVPDMTMEGVTMDDDGFLYVANENGGGDANHPQLWVYAPSTASNLAPTGVTLINQTNSLPENTSTAAAVKVADIAIADDGLGNNAITLSGGDASSFQVVGVALFLKAGTVLNASGKPSYSVTVNVDDAAVGSSPDASVNFNLNITSSTGGTPAFTISEVAPWASGDSTLGADWFELTNTGTATAVITGWKMDDNSNSFGSAVALNGVTNIAPGESVIFIESASGSVANTFKTLWFGATPPANLQVGTYSGSGVGLSTSNDAVNVYNSAGALQANVSFGASPTGPFRTFDNAAGLSNASISALSAVGINGAFAAANHATEIGSPGTVGAPTAPVVTIVATDASASETNDPGSFRISRTGSTISALNVNYILGTGAGKASSSDYTPALSGVVTIPAGQSFMDVTITPVADVLIEGTESLLLTLGDTGSYDVGSPGSATISIADVPPPAPFTAGDLALFQAAASANNTTASIVEIDTVTANQVATQTIPISVTYRFSGSATSTGYLSHSDDRTLLTFNGATGATTGNANTLLPRNVLTLDPTGAFAVKASYTGLSGQQTRSATSLNDSAWFIGDQNGIYTNNSTSPSPGGNFRSTKAFAGVVYVAQAAASLPSIVTVSAPSGTTVTALPGFGSVFDNNLQDFYLVQSGQNGSAYDVIYTLAATSDSAGTIRKYSRVSGTWVANGNATTSYGGFGLAAKKNGSGASLFLTTGQGAAVTNKVFRVDDAAGYNATLSLGATTTLFTAPTGTILKGIDFVPAIIACEPGSFSTSGFAPCTPCAVGSYQGQPGQTACLPCAAGTSQDLSGQTACLPCTAGSYQGQWGQTACLPCAAGSYQSLSGQTACQLCAAGEYQGMTGQTMCVDCSPGSFADASGATMCLHCLAGSAAPSSGSIACAACEGDTVSPDVGAPMCQSCPGGQHADESHTSCVALPLACGAGSSSSSGFEPCTACATGFYQSQTGQTACIACDPGTFADVSGEQACQPCAPGTAIASSGSQACAPCAGDTISANAGAETCQACPAGQHADASHTACVLPPACTAGSFSASGREPCTSCPAGKYQSQAGQTACLPCAVGTAQSQTGQSACVACNPGTFADVSGEQACQPCAPGSAVASSGSQACAPCAGDTISANAGALACAACTGGQHANASHTACATGVQGTPVPALSDGFALALAALLLLLGDALLKRRRA
ncbi:MAG: SdiA-regulated domain-containing protein [Myxococcales bacterium]